MFHLVASLGIAASACIVMASAPAAAQAGGCSGGAAQVTPAVVAGFKTDPGAFLAGLSAGNQDIADMVRRLAAQDPAAIDGPALNAIAKSSPVQASAIARGLGAAARACIDINRPDLAASIQATVLTQFDSSFQAEFARATADTRTAATSAAAAGAGGANGGSGLNLASLGSSRGNAPGGSGSSLFRNSDFNIPATTGSTPTLAGQNTRGTVSNTTTTTTAGSQSPGTSTNSTTIIETVTTILVTRTINASASPTAIGGF